MKRTIEETWRQVSPYLDEVLDLEPGARQAWVEALATRAPDIAAEVGAYLAELAELDKEAFLSVSVASILAPPGPAERCIEPYTLDEIIERGGVGDALPSAEESGDTRRTARCSRKAQRSLAERRSCWQAPWSV